MADTDMTLKIAVDDSAVGAGAAEVEASVKGMGDAAESAGLGFKAMGETALAAIERMVLGAQSARIAVMEMGESFQEARALVSELGEAMIAAFAIEQIAEFAKKMGETAEQIGHTATTFGLTTSQVQALKAEAAGAGVPFDALTNAMMRADRSFAAAKEGSKTAASAFRQAGVDIQGAYTQTQLLNAAIDGLSKMDAGPAKIAAAMAIFGRNIQAIGPIIGLTKDQMAELNATIAASGAISDDAEAKGLALADSFNKNHIDMMGFANAMTSTFAPVLKAVVDDINGLVVAFNQSYNSGGAAKVAMDRIADTLKVLYSAVIVVATGIQLMMQEAVIFGSAFQAVVQEAIHWVEGLGDRFPVLGNIVHAVVGGVVAAFGWIIDKIREVAGALEQFLGNLPVVGGAFRALTGAMSQSAATAAKDWEEAGARIKNVWSDMGKSAPLPGKGKGTTAQDPDGKPKKDSGTETKMQEMQEAFEKIENSHNSMLTDMASDELAFWSDVTGLAQKYGLTQEEIAQVQIKADELKHQAAMKGITEEIAATNKAAQDAIAATNRELSEKKRGISEQISLTENAEKNGEISRTAANAKLADLVNQMVAAEKAAADAIYKARKDADDKIMSLAEKSTDAYKKASADELNAAKVQQAALTEADQDGANQRAKIDQQAADEYQRLWTQRISGVVNAFGSGIKGMITGTETFRQAMLRVGESILDSFVSMIEKMVTKWIVGEIAKTAATHAGTAARVASTQAGAVSSMATEATAILASIAGFAAKAAAAVYADAAAAFGPAGPFVAPALAGGALAAVLDFRGLVKSAAGGYDIPAGVSPMVQTHPEEMILPARIANPIRAMADSYSAANFNAPGAANDGGGDLHAHFHIHGAMDGPSFRDFLESNQDHFQDAFHTMARGGKFSTLGIGR